MTMTIAEFCRTPSNSVTRERIFFHKLYFDLKLAAARRGYALTLFEPEVDRDSYDVMLDDGDTQRRVQLKTVLKTAKTASWASTKRFMRLEEVYGDKLGFAPGDCGVGGGFVLIEIDDTDDKGNVSYLYTDYYVIQALADHIVKEKASRRAYKSFGQPAKDQADFADDIMKELHGGSSRDPVSLCRKHFLRARGPDQLLALLGPACGRRRAFSLRPCDDGRPERLLGRPRRDPASPCYRRSPRSRRARRGRTALARRRAAATEFHTLIDKRDRDFRPRRYHAYLQGVLSAPA